METPAARLQFLQITDEEMGLYSTKWFDYRAYPPETCDLFFAREWLLAREAFYERTGLDVRFDEAGTAYRLPLRWKGLADLKGDAGAWGNLKALRAMADRNGMPYKMFWQIAFRVIADLNEWSNELEAIVGSSLIRSSIVDEFHEHRRLRILMSDSPFLRARAYRGHRYQNDYMAYLTGEVSRRYPATADEKIETLVNEGRIAPQFCVKDLFSGSIH